MRNKGAGSVLNPEICIVVDRRISPKHRTKADAIDAAEGSSLEYVKASTQDTTGVLDQGMDSKG